MITAITTTMDKQLLHLLHLVSPALPVGAYAYSQGQEYAVEQGYLTDSVSAGAWIEGILCHSLAGLDLPILIRCLRAWQNEDLQQVKAWNRYLRACRESAELELEDQQMGRALMRLLDSMAVTAARAWPRSEAVCFVTAFALAGYHWAIALDSLMQGFCWSWLENQVAAATKLVPLGQTQAQQLLLSLMPSVPLACDRAMALNDDELGSGLPGLALLSAQHETQYSRLFRS